MKTILFMAVILTATILRAEESKYELGMNKAMTMMQSSKTAPDMLAASALFERIADSEKDKWLPYYYAAYTNIQSAWMDEKSDKDKLAERSLMLIEKAELLETNNSEIFLLRQMVAIQQMSVDGMSRWKKYGDIANSALDSAKKADPTNPRSYFLEGQSVLNTPKAFGGGEKNARPIFAKAVELYATFVPASKLHPVWGKDEASEMLKQCEK
jgi:hypothetical protein